jgi:hypothetical protein
LAVATIRPRPIVKAVNSTRTNGRASKAVVNCAPIGFSRRKSATIERTNVVRLISTRVSGKTILGR